MIVDIHTHCFNDKLAEKALRKLADASNVRPYGLGRIGDIQDYVLKHAGVDYAVVLNVSTSPGYEHNVNNFSADIDMIDRIISFGSVHPDYEDIYGELKRIKDMGMIGIKLHPDYQGYHFNDKKAYPIYEACQDLGLILLTHAGFDPISPTHVHTTPEGALKVHRDFPDLKLIMAHMGGVYSSDDIERVIAGENIYLDTAVCANYVEPKTIKRLADKHGAEKILLGSDFPWDTTINEMRMLERSGLSSSQLDMIFGENARELLSMDELLARPKIRRMKPENKEDFIQMASDFYSSDATVSQPDVDSFENTFKAIIKGRDGVDGYIISKKDEICGYAVASKSWYSEAGGKIVALEELYIKPEYRGMGIGTQYLKWAKAYYTGAGAKALRLEVSRNNDKAHDLYKTLGYVDLDYLQMFSKIR